MMSTQIKVSLTAAIALIADLSKSSYDVSASSSNSLADGSGAGQANKVFQDIRTLALSATEALDLSGVLLDGFGQPILFTKIKALLVIANANNANNVEVGGAASNGFVSPFGSADDKIKVKPGGTLLLVAPDAAGYAVTPGTADLLQITNGGAGTSVSYQIVLIGA